jgi:hypothetical protein
VSYLFYDFLGHKLTIPQNRIIKFRRPKINKPKRFHFKRVEHIYLALKHDNFRALNDIRYTPYINNDDIYYYNRKTSMKCTEYLKSQRLYDETFSLDEFRKIENQKKEE